VAVGRASGDRASFVDHDVEFGADELLVVLDPDAGDQGASSGATSSGMAWDPPGPGSRQPYPFRGDAGAARGEELVHLLTVVHDYDRRPAAATKATKR
jgi:hypothetical protein